MTDALPTFFIIGAPKCGTTSLYFYLAQHPEIAMTVDKEPQIFAGEDYRSRLGRYASLFVHTASTRGEASVVYSQYPRWNDIPARIRAEIPDARFVYVVGDPVERTVRHYVQLVSDGKEHGSIAGALADLDADDNRIVCPSRYATQVRRYLEHFEPSRILVVDQEDLRSERAATLANVFGFLGVDPAFTSAGFDELHNTQEDRRLPKPIIPKLLGSRVLGPFRRLPYSPVTRSRLRRLMYTPVERPALEPALRSRLAESLRSEVAWLREFSGQDFATWPV